MGKAVLLDLIRMARERYPHDKDVLTALEAAVRAGNLERAEALCRDLPGSVGVILAGAIRSFREVDVVLMPA